MENSFQKRFDEIIRIANMLYPISHKSIMKIIRCNDEKIKNESTFNLRVLNASLLMKNKT